MDSDLTFTLTEVGGAFSLLLTTTRIYPVYNYVVDTSIAMNDKTIVANIIGLRSPQVLLPTLGPAKSATPISYLAPGAYDLVLRYYRKADLYQLTVSENAITINWSYSEFTSPEHNYMVRLPRSAIWLETWSGAGLRGEDYRRIDTLRNQIRQELVALGAIEIQPDFSSYYTNANYVSPAGVRDLTQYYYPVYRTYSYDGDPALLKELARKYAQYTNLLAFRIHTWRGDAFMNR